MKALILFATKSGATKECADILAEKLDCPACDLSKDPPDIASFDLIILGTGVRMGRIYKRASDFIRKNMDLIAHKKIAVFFCNAYADTFDNAVEKNLPSELVQKAICLESFGGKPPFTRPQNTDWLNKDNLSSFIETIRSFMSDEK